MWKLVVVFFATSPHGDFYDPVEVVVTQRGIQTEMECEILRREIRENHSKEPLFAKIDSVGCLPD